MFSTIHKSLQKIPNPFISNIKSTNNEFINIAITSKDIFTNIAKQISLAKYEINITFFVWNSQCDAVKLIGDAIKSNPNNLIIRIIVSECKFIKNKILNQLQKTKELWNLDSNKHQLELYILPYDNLGMWHTKFITIDNNISIITGANIQPFFDFTYLEAKNWLDVSIIIKGDVSQGINNYFENMLKISQKLDCNIIPDKYIKLNPLSEFPVCKIQKPVKIQIPQINENKYNKTNNLPILILSKLPHDKLNNNINYELYQNQADIGIITALLLAKSNIELITPNINDPVVLYTLKDILHSTNIKIKILTSYDFNYILSEHFQVASNSVMIYELINCCEKCKNAFNSHRLEIRFYSYDGKEVIYDHNKHANHGKSYFIDDHISIVTSQNLDIQSFIHSAELGILIDNIEVCKKIKDVVWEENWNKGIKFEYE
jgi:phosphatidylserine/phosphatidylglycerophosphate/cardiolipin synthase-like enzyme